MNEEELQVEIQRISRRLESLYLSMNRVKPFVDTVILSVIISAITAIFTESFIPNWLFNTIIIFILLLIVQVKLKILFFVKLAEISEEIDRLENIKGSRQEELDILRRSRY